MDKEKLGLIHIYCGDGKGKTTASLGLAIRSAGAGFKVFILRFLKKWNTSELNSLELIPNIEIIRGKEGNVFTFGMTEEQKAKSKEIHLNNFAKAKEVAFNGECDILILDEVIGAYNRNLLDREDLLNFLDNKPENLEVILTGRNPDEELIKRADYVSEIQKIKHPFDKGIVARRGIEK